MIINDPVYGTFELNGVLDRLARCKTVQRLSRIRQGGAAFLAFPYLKTTRFEHSVGVSYLIQVLGGSVAEQVAGLLHDISHTAFSHVSDYILANDAEDFHESYKAQFIQETEIAKILQDEGIDCEKLLDDALWPRLEAPMPDLCADRIDYTLRDYLLWARGPVEPMKLFLESMDFRDGKIVLKSLESAQWFANFFQELNASYFRHPGNLYASEELAKILKEALHASILSKDDLFKDDEHVLKKISQSKLASKLEELERATLSKTFPAPTLQPKTRKVDPWVMTSNGMKRLSELHL